MDPTCEADRLIELVERKPQPSRWRPAMCLALAGVGAIGALAARRSGGGTVVRGAVSAARKYAAGEGAFATGPSPDQRTFPWTAPTRSVEDAFQVSFPDGAWEPISFKEGRGVTITKPVLLQWVEEDLLGGSDPFVDHGGRVPVPFPPQEGEAPDQVPPGHWVTYSRRQVCFIAAKSLIGANTDGYANGFLRFLETPAPALGGCTPAKGEFGKALWHLLAACAADPGLTGGAQGPALLVAKASDEPGVDAVRAAADGKPLAGAGLRVCQYGDGAEPLPGVERMPEEACAQPTAEGPGRDFMTGGLDGQGMVDISAAWLGGYTWGYACGLGAGQDERLMVYMPEVFLLSFFLSEAPGTNPQQRNTPQLRQPAWILGARRVVSGLDGTARFDHLMKMNPDVQMSSDLSEVSVSGKTFKISTAQPFLALMSENQDFEFSEGCPGLPAAKCGRECSTRLARDNRLPWQRAVDASCPFGFENQVRAWYRSTALVSYAADVQPALKGVVRSLGTGPWGSGLWWGDSQVFLLVMWIAHAASAATWGQEFPLGYYLYSAFTENPGNQCFVHGGEQCKACLAACGTPPPSAYWLPGFAYSHVDASYTDWGPPPMPPAKACVDTATSCGAKGLADVIAAYKDETAGALWEDVEAVLRGGASAAHVGMPVFDELLRVKASRR